MEYKEALELFNSDDLQEVICHSRLCNYTNTGCSDCPFTHMSIRIREALEKQIPKKPIWEDGHCYCPNKHKSVIKGIPYWTIGTGQAYCDFCGQAID